MAYVAVTAYGEERMFHNKPVRKRAGDPIYDYWQDDIVYWEVRKYTTCADDYSISLPKGTIKKLIGRDLTWQDEPVAI